MIKTLKKKDYNKKFLDRFQELSDIPLLQQCLRMLFNSFKDCHFSSQQTDIFYIITGVTFEVQFDELINDLPKIFMVSENKRYEVSRIFSTLAKTDSDDSDDSDDDIGMSPQLYIIDQNRRQKKGESWSKHDQYLRFIRDFQIYNPFKPILRLAIEDDTGKQMQVEIQYKFVDTIPEDVQYKDKKETNDFAVKLQTKEYNYTKSLETNEYTAGIITDINKSVYAYYLGFKEFIAYPNIQQNINFKEFLQNIETLQKQLENSKEYKNQQKLLDEILKNQSKVELTVQKDSRYDYEPIQSRYDTIKHLDFTNLIQKYQATAQQNAEFLQKDQTNLVKQLSEMHQHVTSLFTNFQLSETTKRTDIENYIKQWSMSPIRILDLRQNAGGYDQIREMIEKYLVGGDQQFRQDIVSGKFKGEGVTIVLLDFWCKSQCSNLLEFLDKLPNVVKVGRSVPHNISSKAEDTTEQLQINYKEQKIFSSSVGQFGVKSEKNNINYLSNVTIDVDVYLSSGEINEQLKPTNFNNFINRMKLLRDKNIKQYQDIDFPSLLSWSSTLDLNNKK